jgi:hypothetical protein
MFLRTSDIIKGLQQVIEEHGDLPVETCVDGMVSFPYGEDCALDNFITIMGNALSLGFCGERRNIFEKMIFEQRLIHNEDGSIVYKSVDKHRLYYREEAIIDIAVRCGYYLENIIREEDVDTFYLKKINEGNNYE